MHNDVTTGEPHRNICTLPPITRRAERRLSFWCFDEYFDFDEKDYDNKYELSRLVPIFDRERPGRKPKGKQEDHLV